MVRLALAAAVFSALGPRMALAVPLPNPIQGETPELYLDDARLSKLSEAQGDYSVRFTGLDASRFSNSAGGVLGVGAEVTFHQRGEGGLLPGPGDGGSGLAGASSATFARSLLVLTSVRLGAPPAGGVSCPIPGSLTLADAGFVESGFGGDLSGPALFVGDRPDGKVCDSEGDLFLAVPFDPELDSPQQIEFQIELGSALPSLAFYFQYQAYTVAPEPLPAGVVLGGLAVLGWCRRRGARG